MMAGRGRRVLLYSVGEPNGGRYLVAGGSNICSLAVRASLWKSRKYEAPLAVDDWNYSSTRRETRDGRDLSTTPSSTFVGTKSLQPVICICHDS